MTLAAETLDRLKAALGPDGWSDDPARIAPKLVEWRGRWRGETPLLLLPRTPQEVALAVRICAETGAAVTPQGGGTGLVGGQIPQGEVLFSTERLRAIREVAPEDDVVVVEAGVTLAEVQAAAAAADRFFPLSLASEGTATIGGLLSTNAGGTAVLRYGTMRDLALGLEAVLPNGELWSGLSRLRKNVSGYDLKQLLIGAEGTLGLITAATLKLFPVLRSRAVAFAGLRSPDDALRLLARAKVEGAVEAFELMGRASLGLVLKNIPGARDPLAEAHPWYVLIETATAAPGEAEPALERILAAGLEADLLQDAVLAKSEAEARELWALRENHSAAQKPEGEGWKHDISVPLSRMAEFIQRGTALALQLAPGAKVTAFGHVGDGNVHFDVLQPPGKGAAHAAAREEGSRALHDLAHELGGSLSAEHGLGVLKSTEALRYKSEAEVAAHRAIRAALDPRRIMNPRVLF
ncbi:MAG: FAD-binding oxidoreductase [Proteobacteria bacterium]|nr:FAD-binding oxidoreductase [Pseudomonadota bacterium]